MKKYLVPILPILMAGCDSAAAADKVIAAQGPITSVAGVLGAMLGQPWVLGVVAGGFALLKGWHKPALTGAGNVVGSIGDGLQNGTPHIIGVVASICQHVEDFLKAYGVQTPPKA